MDDTQAISAILRGDKNRYEELVARHKKMVYAIAWSHLGNRELSEDAAQETFVKAYCYLGTLREPGKFSWWVARIARNVCNSFRRKLSRETAFTKRWAVLEAAEPQGPDVSRGSLEEQLWESFARLPDIHREALTVFYIEGKSVRESADLLGISETAIRARLNRARTALREQLEQRLEDTLDSLQPSESFTRSVMVMLPLSPIGVMGTGGVLAGLGKLSATLAFALSNVVATVLPVGLISWCYSRMETANIKGTQENQFRKALISRKWIGFAIMMIVIMLLINSTRGHVGQAMLCQLIVVTFLPAIYASIRLARVNRHAVLMLVATLMTFSGMTAVGFFHAPDCVIPITFLAAIVLGYINRKQIPSRADYNIFLRCATGGIKDVNAEDTPTVHPEPVEGRLSDLELRSFARFLGEQWLVRDYSLRSGELVMWLPSVRGGLYGPFAGTSSGSRVTIGGVGDCTATVNAGDLKAIRRLAPSGPEADELQQEACRAVQSALRCFMNGDLDGARSILTAQSDEAVFKKPVHKSTFWRVMMALGVGVWVLILIAPFILHHYGIRVR